jgi:hypothetical protein
MDLFHIYICKDTLYNIFDFCNFDELVTLSQVSNNYRKYIVDYFIKIDFLTIENNIIVDKNDLMLEIIKYYLMCTNCGNNKRIDEKYCESCDMIIGASTCDECNTIHDTPNLIIQEEACADWDCCHKYVCKYGCKFKCNLCKIIYTNSNDMMKDEYNTNHIYFVCKKCIETYKMLYKCNLVDVTLWWGASIEEYRRKYGD